MCVIAGGLKKNMRRAELVQGFRVNDAGFYLAILKDTPNGPKKRELVKEIRTLDEADALKAFDEAEDDCLIVSHARIPSHGQKSLDNVHGWECEGVRFMHNGTLTNVMDVMDKSDTRTDSEFFFREVFIPLWKSQGRNFNKLVELVVNSIRGSSRFCFIMPDGEVKLYGDYVKDHDCWFSNRSYQVSEYSWSGGCGGGGWGRDVRSGSPMGFGAGSGPNSVSGCVGPGVRGVSGVVPKRDVKKEEEEEVAGAELAQLLGGPAGVAKLVLQSIVARNVLASTHDDLVQSIPVTSQDKPVYGSSMIIDNIEQGVYGLCPTSCNDDVSSYYDNTLKTMQRWLEGSKLTQEDLKNFLEDYAAAAEELIFDGYTSNRDPKDQVVAELASFAPVFRLTNTSFDWTATKLKRLCTSWKAVENRKHQLKMVERTPEELFGLKFDDPPKPYGKLEWYNLADNLALVFEAVRKGKPTW